MADTVNLTDDEALDGAESLLRWVRHLEKLRDIVAYARNAKRDLNAQLAALQNQIDATKQESVRLPGVVAKVKSDLQELESRMAQRKAILENEVGLLEASVKPLRETVAGLESRIKELTPVANELIGQVQTNRTAVLQAKDTLADLQKQKTAVEARMKELKASAKRLAE